MAENYIIDLNQPDGTRKLRRIKSPHPGTVRFLQEGPLLVVQELDFSGGGNIVSNVTRFPLINVGCIRVKKDAEED